jgi:hypothetical protein
MVYFKLFFMMTDVGNLNTKLQSYFKLSFITTNVGNLDTM